jgi:hypothetical protein
MSLIEFKIGRFRLVTHLQLVQPLPRISGTTEDGRGEEPHFYDNKLV